MYQAIAVGVAPVSPVQYVQYSSNNGYFLYGATLSSIIRLFLHR